MQSINDWLSKIPSTNLKTFTAVLSACAVVATWCAAIFFEKTIEATSFGVLVAFIYGWLFDGRKHFEAKRHTQWSEGNGNGNGNDRPSNSTVDTTERKLPPQDGWH